MDIKKERARLERLEKLLDMYEQGEMRIKSNSHSVGLFAEFDRVIGGFIDLSNGYKKRVADTKAAMQRIEIAYNLTLNQ